ncbi:hypothetical protein Tco_0897303 [Tanacetum coccineum]
MVSIGGSLTPYYGLDRRSRSVVFGSKALIARPELLGCSSGDDTNADSNATLEPVYAEDSQVSKDENDNGHISVISFQTFDQRTRRSADALPTIAYAEVPHSRNHVKSPWTQDTKTEGAPFDREVRNTAGDKIGKEYLHFAPNPKVCKTILDRVPTPTQLLKAEGLTLKELSDRMNVLMCLRFLMEEQTLIIVRVNKHGAQLPAQVEHLSAELANPKGANHALEKANHSRFKKYKKYNVEKDSLVLEKEKLENELLKILAASKQDKESFAKGKSQLDLQETELGDQKHQPSIEQSETHKLKNAIIKNERDLFEDSSKRTSRDLFKNSSIVASSPKHLLVSSPWRESAPTKDHIITPGKILYHRSGGGYELTRESAPTKDYTITVG